VCCRIFMKAGSDMSAIEQARDRYCQLVERTIFATDAQEAELYLSDAFELGRALIFKEVSPDDVVAMHHEAIIHLARIYPCLSLSSVADRLTRPMMELLMAYGLAFREQMAQRYEAMVNARLEQSRKLEAVGMLASGIAHDFNNIVGSIVGFAEMTGDAFEDGAPEKENIRWILAGCYRARDLVGRMLAFARQTPGQPVRLDIANQVHEAVAMLSASLDKRIEIIFDNVIRHAFVMADPGQIQQVVMNLCINASDSMDGHGAIVIRLAPARRVDDVPAGHENSVLLTVADTGHGMSPEVQTRVFNPFFTTKAPDGRSGLGLSVVHGIVKELGGVIRIRSRSTGSETGTEFRIFLPAAPDAT